MARRPRFLPLILLLPLLATALASVWLARRFARRLEVS